MTFDAPIICPPAQVESDWIDYNGHMNMAFYNVVFDRGLDAIFDLLGVGEAYARTGGSCFTVEAHATYIQELNEHDPLRVEYQLLGYDTKRIHSFERLYHATEGYLAATSEQMSLHVSMATRRAGPFPDEAQGKLAALMKAHESLERPEQAGHVMAIPKPK